MRVSLFSRSLFAVACLTGASAAQGFQNPFTLDYDFDWSYDPGLRNAEVGNLDGDDHIDVVVHGGSDVVMLPGPEVYDTRYPLPINGHASVVVPGSGTSGRDSVLVANASGLHELWLDEQPPSYDQLDWEQETVVTAVWNNVVRMLVRDIAAFPQEDLIGLDGTNNRTFHFLLRNPADDWIYFPSFSAQNDVPDAQFDMIDDDLDGIQDVVAVTTFGLEVMNFAGTVLWSFGNAFDPGEVVTFTDSGAQRIAWVRTADALGTLELVVVDPGGVPEPPLVFPLGDVTDVISISAGDLDDDRDDDLMIIHSGSTEGIVLLQQDDPVSSFVYDTNDTTVTRTFDWGIQGSTSVASAHPVFRDLNHDRYADALLPLDGTPARLRFQDGAGILEMLVHDPVTNWVYGKDASNEYYLDLTINPSGLPAQYDCMWVRSLMSTGPDFDDTVHQVYCGQESSSTSLRLYLDSQQVPTADVLWWELRLTPAECYGSTSGPGIDKDKTYRSTLYEYTFSGDCSTWPIDPPTCTEDAEFMFPTIDGPPGTIVGVFRQTNRIQHAPVDLQTLVPPQNLSACDTP